MYQVVEESPFPNGEPRLPLAQEFGGVAAEKFGISGIFDHGRLVYQVLTMNLHYVGRKSQ